MKTDKLNGIQVLAFDVFGTVVDWHGSISQEVASLKLPVDPDEFANAWRDGYRPAMSRVRSGELPWTRIDARHRLILDQILVQFNLNYLEEDIRRNLNLVWHRLKPWEDSVFGLQRLKTKFVITTLSNGNLGLLTNMAKNAGLPWDLILSAEVFRRYKPDPETYLGVADIFEIQPHQVMLVAAHKDDLLAAHKLGLKTAFIERPREFGRNVARNDLHRESWVDFHASDFNQLADYFQA